MSYIKERVNSFKYAITGIVEVLSSQANPKIHLLAALFSIIGGIYFGISDQEWCLVILCITLVLGAETINTAIEHLTDLASPEFHPLAKKAKDAAAGGVLWIAIGALFTGIIIFLPKLSSLFLQ